MEAASFIAVPGPGRAGPSTSPRRGRRRAPSGCRAPHAAAPRGDDGGDGDGDDDAALLEALRRAANDRLGAPVPESPFAKCAAASAEGDFLRAMEEAREEFAEARARTGTTEDAVREVMGRIEREEATLEAMERNFGDGGGGQDGGDGTGGGIERDDASSFQ
jgi:hypothetical protein